MSIDTEERLLWLVVVMQIAQAFAVGILAMELNSVKIRVARMSAAGL